MALMTWLQEWYQRYNTQYFKGKLGKCRVAWDRRIERFGWLGEFDSETPEIHIAQELKHWRNTARLTLLHEMVHMKLHNEGHRRTDHGPKFQKEMMRLAKLGAFKLLW